jgi:hypothetical protein
VWYSRPGNGVSHLPYTWNALARRARRCSVRTATPARRGRRGCWR